MSAGGRYGIPVMLLGKVRSSRATLQHGRHIHQTCEKYHWVTAVELLKFYEDGNAAIERRRHLPGSEVRIFFRPVP